MNNCPNLSYLDTHKANRQESSDDIADITITDTHLVYTFTNAYKKVKIRWYNAVVMNQSRIQEDGKKAQNGY